MAALSQIITNQVGLFGPAPTDNWGDYDWGDFLWAEGTKDFASTILKVISESVVPDSSVAKSQAMIITNDLSPVSAMSYEQVTDSAGYVRVFPSDVTNAEDRAFPTWAKGSGSTTSWSNDVASSTTWSAA